MTVSTVEIWNYDQTTEQKDAILAKIVELAQAGKTVPPIGANVVWTDASGYSEETYGNIAWDEIRIYGNVSWPDGKITTANVTYNWADDATADEYIAFINAYNPVSVTKVTS
jgi:hypothetical protein